MFPSCRRVAGSHPLECRHSERGAGGGGGLESPPRLFTSALRATAAAAAALIREHTSALHTSRVRMIFRGGRRGGKIGLNGCWVSQERVDGERQRGGNLFIKLPVILESREKG